MLSQDFECQIIVWNKVDTPSHNTECLKCNSNCHVPCSLPKAMDSESLIDCASMNRGINNKVLMVALYFTVNPKLYFILKFLKNSME